MAASLKRIVRSDWSQAILVCRKCSKKLGGGFGDKRKTPLAKALRRRLDLKKGRKSAVGIVEVKCLGVCPKNAVTVVSGGDPGNWRIIPAGTPIEDAVRSLAIPGPACAPD